MLANLQKAYCSIYLSIEPPMQTHPPDRKTPLHPAIITHLQSILEAERIAVSRELHDEMGGLLVAAVMDVAWAEQHVGSPEEVREKLARVRQTLASAIDLKRTLIEQLRPSLLDNFGLFAAFRWHVKHSCDTAGIACKDHYPTEEPPFTADALTGLYRILQEALAITLKQPLIQSLEVEVTIAGNSLTIRIAHAAPKSPKHAGTAEPHAIAIAAMKHRVRLLGGKSTLRARKNGGRVWTARVPLVGTAQGCVGNSLLTH